MNNDLKIIKKYYGENMMHLCRELFSTILEIEGLLSKIMLDTFAPNRFLYEDIIEQNKIESFKNNIYELSNLEIEDNVKTNKTPEELLDEAGYYLYECKTEKEIQYFKKYYESKEELCTFNGGRLDRCHVFFAVKKDVDNIKRKHFKNPERQDEYGTSVISIQFTKGKINTLSIKNRYNHTVSNPDATFSNNLENIIPGLTESFEKKYNLNINQNTSKDFDLRYYVKANDKKYYKYNYERNNIYYCPNNIIIDNYEVKQLEKEKYILLDYFIIDLVNKEIYLYDTDIKDSFIDGLNNIQKINITKIPNSEEKQIELILEEGNRVIIKIDKVNRIIEYTNNNLIEVRDNFLYINRDLKKLAIPNVEFCGANFLQNNKNLKNLYAFELRKVGNCFLQRNEALYEIIVPKLEQVGTNFLSFNNSLNRFSAPKLEKIGDYFLHYNEILNDIKLPRVKKIGRYFLNNNRSIEYIDLPETQTIYDGFMWNNTILKSVNFPKLKEIKDYFLYENKSLNTINLPEVVEIGDEFMRKNQKIRLVHMPNVIRIGEFFLFSAKFIRYLNFPKLRYFGQCSLIDNKYKIKLYSPELQTAISDKQIKKIDKGYRLHETSIMKLQRLLEIEKPKQKVKTRY